MDQSDAIELLTKNSESLNTLDTRDDCAPYVGDCYPTDGDDCYPWSECRPDKD